MPKVPASQPRVVPCIECGTDVTITNPYDRHRFGLCGDVCRKERARKRKRQFKKTPKGVAAERRWRKNPSKRRIDTRSRQRPEGRRKAVEINARYRKNHRQRVTEANTRLDRLRRRMRRSTGPKFAAWREWWREHHGRGCAQCGRKEPEVKLTIDHVHPRIKGGSDDLKNLQVLCRQHNGEKGYGRQRTSSIWKK